MKLNELVAIPSNQNITEKSNLHISKLIFLLPLLLLISNSSHGFRKKNTSVLDLSSDLLSSIDIRSLNENINIVKKIGPYLPENIVVPMNSIIYFVEKATKIIGLIELISTNKSYEPVATLENLSSKDRFNGILQTINEEISEDRINSIKPIIDIALNFDKYKSLINMVSSLGNTNNKLSRVENTPPKPETTIQSNENRTNQIDDIINIMKPMLGNDEKKVNQLNSMVDAIKPMLSKNDNKTNQIEGMVNAIKPMLGNNENISSEKVGDMLKMIELLNVLNSKDNKKDPVER